MLINNRRFSYFKILKFDWYILQEVVGSFIGSGLFVLFILLMFQALRLAEFLIIHSVSATLLGRFSLFIIISSMPYVLSLAFLISVLMAMGRLSSDSEFIAMKASGLGIFRIAMPVFAFAILITTISVFFNLRWVPWANLEAKNTELKIGNTRAIAAIKEGTFNSGFFNLLIFADKVDTATNRLHKVFIYDEREAANPLTYVAKEGEILRVKTVSDLDSAISLRLFNGSMHHNLIEENTYEKIDFESYHLYLEAAGGNHGVSLKPRMIPQKELIETIKTFPTSTWQGRELRGEFWRRYATALCPFIFTFIGIGFGTFRSRTAKSGAILTGLVIVSVYWSAQVWVTTATLEGRLDPFLAMQLPNLIILIPGLFGFRRAAW